MKKCQFCTKFDSRWKQFFILNRALHFKYSSNTNYYSTNEVTELVTEKKGAKAIEFKAKMDFEDVDEFLKEYYERGSGKERLEKFLEFYKYHKEIPRFFMEKVGGLIMKYHTGQRQLHYDSVKRKLNLDFNTNPSNSASTKKNGRTKSKAINAKIENRMLESHMKFPERSHSHTIEEIIAEIAQLSKHNTKAIPYEKSKAKAFINSSASKTKSNTRTLNLDISVGLGEELEISKFKKFLSGIVVEKSKPVFQPKNLKSISTLKGKKFSIRDTRQLLQPKQEHASATFTTKPQNSKESRSGLRVKQSTMSRLQGKRKTEGSDNFTSADFRISSSQLNIRHTRLKSQAPDFNSTKRMRFSNVSSLKNINTISQKAKMQLAHNKGIYEKIKNQLFGQK